MAKIGVGERLLGRLVASNTKQPRRAVLPSRWAVGWICPLAEPVTDCELGVGSAQGRRSSTTAGGCAQRSATIRGYTLYRSSANSILLLPVDVLDDGGDGGPGVRR